MNHAHRPRFRRARLPLATVFLLAAASLSCEGPPEGDPNADEPIEVQDQALITNPQIDFSPQPSYLPPKTIVLTFDDGPDSTNTVKVLDILKKNGLKATFFLNTNNYTDVEHDPGAQNLIKRMAKEGHEIGNHTVHHPNITGLTSADLEKEIAGVETTLKKILGASRRVTLFRAPYGEPYDPQGQNRKFFGKVAPVVARHAVHIGWAITPQDAGGCSTATCVFNAVKAALSRGDYGVILMHSTQAHTVAALQKIIDYAKANGYKFKLTEDVVRARYGQSSSQIIK